MAINKPTSIDDTGLEVSYWRVLSVTLNKDTNTIDARVVAYKDKASRDAGKKYIMSANVSYDATGVADDENLIAWIYGKLETIENVMLEPSMEQTVILSNGEEI